MATQTDKVIVDVDNGTFIHIEQVVLVDLNDLTQDELNDFNNGYDGSIMEIADDKGTSVMSILKGCGYGDLNYLNCIAFSPNAIRDEIHSNIEMYADSYETQKTLLNMSDEQLQSFADSVNSDWMWDRFVDEMKVNVARVLNEASK
jgi:hypothetical protein